MCPNPSCGKVFHNPLKAKNVGIKPVQAFEACPYCLTEIVINASSLATEEESMPEMRRTITGEARENASGPILTPKSTPTIASAKCAHELGYLSKRTSKESIPEECIMCTSIVQCMLKNVTG